MTALKLTDIRKSYGSTEVIHGVDLEIDQGQFIVFVGPSGCGKSTLLRMIAGLESITDGVMEIDGQRVNEVPPSMRGIAMVFQTYALYPHMTVYDNMSFGLKIAKAPKEEVDRRVREAAAILQLEPYLVASVNVLQLDVRSVEIRKCFFLMNRYPIWMLHYVSQHVSRSQN